MKVAVIGASDKPERYAYKAVKLLLEYGHEVFPVHPRLEQIEGLKVYPNLEAVPGPVDTVTLYVGPAGSDKVAHQILAAKPRRIIFNPGAENPPLEEAAKHLGILTVEGCTLVLLKTNQF